MPETGGTEACGSVDHDIDADDHGACGNAREEIGAAGVKMKGPSGDPEGPFSFSG